MPEDPKKPVKKKKIKSKLRRILDLCLVAVLALLFFTTTGQFLSKAAIRQIESLTHTKIITESVRFRPNGAVVIKGLVVKNDDHKINQANILSAEKVTARFGIGSLLLFRPQLKKISIHDFVIDAQHDLDTDRWNISVLGWKKGRRRDIPTVRLKRGLIQYSTISKGLGTVVASIPIQGRLSPADLDRQDTSKGSNNISYDFEINTANNGNTGDKSTLKGSWKPGRVEVTGGISSSDFEWIKEAWSINLLTANLEYNDNKDFKLKLRVKDFRGKQSFAGILGRGQASFFKKSNALNSLMKFFYQYQPRGIADADIQASGNLENLTQSQYSGVINCKDISACYRNFVYPLDHITGEIHLNQDGLYLKDFGGKHGDVNLSIEGERNGFGKECDYDFHIITNDMILDKDFYNALPVNWQKIWDDFSVQGSGAGDYNITMDRSGNKNTTLAIEAKNGAATYRYMPYPLKNLTGNLFFDKNGVKIKNLVDSSKEHTITLNGNVYTAPEKKGYEIFIKAENLPIDQTLLSCVPDEGEDFFMKFKQASDYGNGRVSIEGRVWDDDFEEKPDCRISLKTGELTIDENLTSMLSEGTQNIIKEFRPVGKVRIGAEIDRRADQKGIKDFDTVTVQCLGNTINWEKFPYQVNNVTGSITITKNKIILNELTGYAANNITLGDDFPGVKVTGQVALENGEITAGSFKLKANDLFFDERFGEALPKKARDFYNKLAPTGRFDVDLEKIDLITTDDGSMHFNFDGRFDLKGSNFQTSPVVTDLYATWKTTGTYDVEKGFNDITTFFDAQKLRIKDKQLTDMTANVNYDSANHRWISNDLNSKFYEGNVAAKFELVKQQEKSEDLTYTISAGFFDVNVRDFLAEGQQNKNDYTSGKMQGYLTVTGDVGDIESRIGKLDCEISQMNVGKLSPLMKILCMLKLTEPTDFAFDSMMFNSYIKKENLFFEKIDMSGHSLAFEGNGQMNLDTKALDIDLTARGERLATAEPSVLQSLADNFGKVVLKMEVKGTYDDPKVITTALPILKETFDLLSANTEK